MPRVRKKRLRVKWKNVFKLLVVVMTIIFTFNFTKNFIFNMKVYNNIKGSNLIIKSNKKVIKLNNKNVSYITKSNVKVKINNKGDSYILKNEYINNKTKIRLNKYKKTVTKKEFNSSRGLFIYDDKINDGNIVIKLPRFLYKKGIVDIYGVNGDSYKKLYTRKVSRKKVSFDYNTNYEKYFIVYVKPKSIKTDENVKVLKNRTQVLNINVYPKYSTNVKFEYENVDKKYISIKNNTITAKKVGNTSFIVKIGRIKKKIFVVILSDEYKVKKNDGIYYVDDIMIVNKTYPLPQDYDPGDLLDETKEAFSKMQNAAYSDGIKLWITSGYRSYAEQEKLYNEYVSANSKEEADTYSARPGYSEHQTGYVIDVNDATFNFNGTKEAEWIKNNSYKYGFIVRYPEGKEDYTGYQYESWHLRYIGVDKATKINKTGLSLEEYYGLTSKYKN